MNTPNKLTVLRVILVPVFMAFLMVDTSTCKLISMCIFIAAAITDWFDGYLARKNGQVTSFGKFMDPLADKMLTTAAFLGLMHYGYVSAWALVIILAREFMVSGVRMAAAERGCVIAASMWGKFKTVAQMVTIIASILLISIPFMPEGVTHTVICVMVWISAALTLISGMDYLIRNRDCLKME